MQAFIGEHHAQLAALLDSVKGVGKATISTLLAEVRELGELIVERPRGTDGPLPVRQAAGDLRVQLPALDRQEAGTDACQLPLHRIVSLGRSLRTKVPKLEQRLVNSGCIACIVESASGTRGAQALLGHTTESMTADYIRHKVGKKVKLLR